MEALHKEVFFVLGVNFVTVARVLSTILPLCVEMFIYIYALVYALMKLFIYSPMNIFNYLFICLFIRLLP